MTDQNPSLSFEDRDAIAALDDVLREELPVETGGFRLLALPLPADEQGPWGGQRGPVVVNDEALCVVLSVEQVVEGEASQLELSVFTIGPRSTETLVEAPVRLRAVVRVARDMLASRSELTAQNGYLTPPLWALRMAMKAIEKRLAGKKKPVEAWEEALRKNRSVAEQLLPPSLPAEVTTGAVAALEAWLAEHSPLVRLPTFELLAVGDWQRPDDPSRVTVTRHGLRLTIQMVIFEVRDGERTVRDIKEQQIVVVDRERLADIPRFIAYLDALVRVLPGRIERQDDSVDTWMPHDLFDPKVLDLKRPRTVEDFVAALERRW